MDNDGDDYATDTEPGDEDEGLLRQSLCGSGKRTIILLAEKEHQKLISSKGSSCDSRKVQPSISSSSSSSSSGRIQAIRR